MDSDITRAQQSVQPGDCLACRVRALRSADMRRVRWLMAASVPLGVLCSAAPVATADEGCGVGMYFDTQTQQCEPWVPVGYDVPAIPVPIPDFNVGLPGVGVGVGGVGVGVNVGVPRIDPAIAAPRLDAPAVAPRLDAPALRGGGVPIHGGGRR